MPDAGGIGGDRPDPEMGSDFYQRLACSAKLEVWLRR